jgi:hypothetical protein
MDVRDDGGYNEGELEPVALVLFGIAVTALVGVGEGVNWLLLTSLVLISSAL